MINTQAAELARKEGAARLQACQGGEAASGLSAPVTVSRTATQNLQPKEVDAALRADAGKLPAWVGVDLGDGGYSVIKVNAVQPRAAVSAEQATAEVSQFTQVWASAESQAYYDWLKKQLKVEIKVAKPTLGGLNG